MDAATEFLAGKRHRNDILGTWQSTMLRHTRQSPTTHAIVLSILAHTFDAEVMMVLLRVTFPGFMVIEPPFICSPAKVNKRGQVVADYVRRDENIQKDAVIFRSLDEMKGRMRHLADCMKLTDHERIEFFTVAKRWVVADHRLDPNMNPADPDARRLTVH